MSREAQAREFLKRAEQFRLGHLPTENPHPLTIHLSQWAQTNLSEALKVLAQVDRLALEKVAERLPEIQELGQQIQEVLTAGGRIFLCGCGATGRLSLSLENLWREQYPGSEQIISFMAGGDVALVHSLEGFEDYPEYGARHLKQLGFKSSDLLVACTEGGETPYVIGATLEAASSSRYPAYYLYCNPREQLVASVERSREVIEHSNVNDIELFVGPMALAGSTRMQASTVLQLAVGLALFEENVRSGFDSFVSLVERLNYQKLKPFIEAEAQCYQNGEYVFYRSSDFSITVFTDTTERAPTFNLRPFENGLVSGQVSLCYVGIPRAKEGRDAWKYLLGRSPRPLDWLEINEKTSSDYLYSFDFSQRAEEKRSARLAKNTQVTFDVLRQNEELKWQFKGNEESWLLSGRHPLYDHLLLKLLLNTHSTLIMGILGRYRNNIMTWVTPTNGKLIDRATRYVQYLLLEEGFRGVPYEAVVLQLYKELEALQPSESIVVKAFEALTRKST